MPRGYGTEKECIARFIELLQTAPATQSRISQHQTASADIQAAGVTIAQVIEVAGAPDALNVLRVVLEIVWGLGYRAATTEAQRECLSNWQVEVTTDAGG